MSGCKQGRFIKDCRTQEEAEALVKMLNKTGVYFNAYSCEQCGAWHVGHLPREKQYVKKPKNTDH